MKLLRMNNVFAIVVGVIAVGTLVSLGRTLFSGKVSLGPETIVFSAIHLLIGVYFSLFFLFGKLR